MISRKLRHRITIQQYTEQNGPFGGEGEWSDYRNNVAAEVTFLSAKELVASGAEMSEVSARILVRYDKNINAKMRLLFRDELYEIQGAIPDNESGLQWLTLFVSKGLAHN